MSAIVQISFEHNWSEEQLHQSAREFAQNVKPTIQGLVWKIFVKDAGASRSSGIYLFDSLESATDYVNGERVQGMKRSPDLSNLTVSISETMVEESILAGAPL
jgi:hypothetical protein